MADLSYIVDYSQLKAANKELTKVGTTAQKSASVFEKAFARAERAQKRYLSEVRQQITFSQRMEAQKAREAAAALKATRQQMALNQRMEAQKAKELATEERLRSKFIQGHATKALYKKELEQITAARQRDIISASQQRDAVARLTADMKAGTGVFAQNSAAMNISSRGMNSAGMAMQQVGYQTGDFLVQIQSGTNAMVAFGQQATQLVGILPMFNSFMGLSGTALIGLSAGLGIAIPLLTALGAVFMRTRQRSKESAEGIETLDEKLKSLDNTLKEWLVTKKAAEMGITAEELLGVQGIDEATKSLAEARENLESFLQAKENIALTPEGAAINAIISGLQAVGLAEDEAELAQEALEKYTAAWVRLAELQKKQAEERGQNFAEEIRDLQQSEQLLATRSQYGEDSVQYLRVEAAQRKANYGAQVASLDLEESQILALIRRNNAHEDANTAYQEGLLLSEKRVANEEKIADFERLHRNAVFQRNRVNRQAIIDMEAQLALQQAIAAYGADSVEVVRLRAQQEAISLNLTTENQQRYIELAVQIHNSKTGAEGLADALKEASSAMQSLVSFSDNLDRALAVSAAKVDALRTGADAAVAGTIAGMRADLDARMNAAVSSGMDRGIIEAEFGGERARISELEASLRLEKELQAARTAANRKGSTSETGEEAAQKLLREAEAKARIVGLTQEQARYEELLFKMQESNASKREPLTEAELKAYADKIHAIQEQTRVAEEAAEKQRQLSETITRSMENAFMSMVDGTKSVKEAFRDMAAEIIRELYRVIVVQTMVNSIKTSLGFMADGGVFSGGSQVQAYANGGVVGGPTFFPMAGGKTGLMGEAGPEAIMPLKRGRDGKLGVHAEGSGGDTINVVQNFSFQANGDESVKKLIAQAAPQIAKMTKSSLLDDRRRGGATRAAFG